jgi:hypothetical protein
MAVSISPSPCVGIGRGDAARIHQPRDRRAEAGEGEGRQPEPCDRQPRETRRLAVAADGIEPAAVGRLLEHDPDDRHDREREEGEVRQDERAAVHHPDLRAAAREAREGFGDVPAEDRPPAARDERRAR